LLRRYFDGIRRRHPQKYRTRQQGGARSFAQRDSRAPKEKLFRRAGRYTDWGRSVTYWFKQDEIHAHTHVHGCPAFLPWHRELVNRFEQLIREIDPQLSLHYWDWTQDPHAVPDGNGGTINLFSTDFMGSDNGLAGEPWQANAAAWRPDGFYVPDANPFRSDNEFDPNNNPFDPPRDVTRAVQAGAPITAAQDQAVITARDWPTLNSLLTNSHNTAHGFIGGTLGDPHTSFRDPFVFLLHSNLDRREVFGNRC
jgi:hypothetical protein